MKPCTDDFGLDPEQLQEKYQKYDYHWKYTRVAHVKAQSRLQYWHWVEEALGQEWEAVRRSMLT